MITFRELQEGVYDPNIFKAFFLAGGPGSGKSFVVRQTTGGLGLKILNSDDIYERDLEKAGLDAGKPEDIFSDEGQAIRDRSKEKTAKRQSLWVDGRLGIIIDGTGKDASKILRQRGLLQKLGYSTAMILVNTDKETALKRNDARPRRLDPVEVGKMWDEVQSNLGRYQTAFKKNFVIVDNSEGKDYSKETLRAYRIMSRFAKAEPQNPIAQKWIATQKEEVVVKSSVVENFTSFITEQKNTHMTHIEDKVLYGGVKGTREAINALRNIRDMLAGTSSGRISTKWDGAPAIFCGEDPRDGEFFVAKKGIFNKDPKVYKTAADIEADTTGDLSDKLKLALKHLKPLNIKGCLLYTSDAADE